MTEIKIIGVETIVDRTKKNHNSLVSFSNGGGNLELEVETNQPFWVANGELGFADPSAFGTDFRVINVTGNNGAGRYADQIKSYIEREYRKQYSI